MFQNDTYMLNTVPSDCFGAILGMAMQEAGFESYRSFEHYIQEQGITDITYRRLSEYCNGIYTPPMEKARLLLDVLDYSISDQELISCLKANREYSKLRPRNYRKKEDKEIRIFARLKLSKLMPHQLPDRTALLLSERIEDLCGAPNAYTEYVQALIAKDLSEYILNKDFIITQREESDEA